MGGKKFSLEFTNLHRSYFPGDSVTGRVVVTSRKKIHELTLRFVGQAKVNWNDSVSNQSSSTKDKEKTVVYQNFVNYFDSEISLLNSSGKGNKTNGSNEILVDEAGFFPFSFTLPMGLPSSYIGKSGQVMYYAEVCLKFHKSNNELRQKIPFTVNGIVDLNTEPGAAQSVEVRKYKHLCCLCCRTGPVGFKLMIDRKGFVPGESLKFTMEINNQSRRHVSGVCLQLMQTVQFHAKKNTSEDLRIIRKIKGPQVKPGETETWTGKTFQIPPIPPSRLANCAIIDVQYSLEIEMKISGIGKNLKGSIPIVIGTIPFRRMFEEINSRNSQNISSLEGIVTASTSKKLAPPRPIGPPILLEAYPDLPPPSYAEAINISEGGGRTNAVGLKEKSYESYAKVSGSAPIPRSGIGNLGFDFEEAFVPNYVIYA